MKKEKAQGAAAEILKLRIVKPADDWLTWEELGATLRALRAPLHRVLNKVVTDLEVGVRSGELCLGPAKLGKANGQIQARTRCYQLARDHWEAERLAAEARVASGKFYQGDEEIAVTKPTSRVILGCAGAAFAKWSTWHNKLAWKGTASLPTFRGGHPIHVVGGGVQLASSDGNVVLSVPLADRGGPKRVRLIVEPDGAREWAKVHKVLADPESLGEIKILRAKSRQGNQECWMVYAARTFLLDSAPTEGRTMAVHRGVWSFLSAVIAREGDKEAYAMTPIRGDDIVEHKRRYSARRRQLGQHGSDLGRGARGHGKSRRFERLTKLEDGEARWVRTRCQQAAADLVRLATKRGVTTILLDDWGNPETDAPKKKKSKKGSEEAPGVPHENKVSDEIRYFVASFPFATLKDSIIWAAKKAGITVKQVSGAYETLDCPKCGHRHERRPLSRDKGGRLSVWTCEKCMLERNADQIATWNMLVKNGYMSPYLDQRNAVKRAQGRMKAAQETASV